MKNRNIYKGVNIINNMLNNLEQILRELRTITSNLKLSITDAELVDFGVRIYNSYNMQGNNKNIKVVNKDAQRVSSPTSPATQKQLDLLYKLNVDFDAETISKQEAKILIEEHLNKHGKK